MPKTSVKKNFEGLYIYEIVVFIKIAMGILSMAVDLTYLAQIMVWR